MSYRVNGLNKFSARLRSAAQKLQDGQDEVLQDAADYGIERMQRYIASRGTEKSGKAGRIETWHMYNSVTKTDVRHNPSGVAISFGWVDETEPYFFYQEEGTRTISPMHALLDATVETREYFYNEVKQLVRKL